MRSPRRFGAEYLEGYLVDYCRPATSKDERGGWNGLCRVSEVDDERGQFVNMKIVVQVPDARLTLVVEVFLAW
eukprot:8084225-Pyramimonas_sp.AAC.1